jgi:hypothetical protein
VAGESGIGWLSLSPMVEMSGLEFVKGLARGALLMNMIAQTLP